MDKKILYLDQDGPLADFEIGIGREVGHPERGTWDKDPKPMYEKNFFRNLPVTAGAREAVETLLDMPWLDIYVATKPMIDKRIYYSATEKFQWLDEHFPQLVHRTFLTCCKGHLNGDFLIDDNSARWRPIFSGEFIYFDTTNPEKSWHDIVKYFSGREYDKGN